MAKHVRRDRSPTAGAQRKAGAILAGMELKPGRGNNNSLLSMGVSLIQSSRTAQGGGMWRNGHELYPRRKSSTLYHIHQVGEAAMSSRESVIKI